MVGLTALIAVTTFVLAVIARNQLKTQSQQTATALQLARDSNALNQTTAHATAEYNRQTIVLTHRPQIKVRHVTIHGIAPHMLPPQLTGYVWVANVGFTTAKIVRFTTEWRVSEGLPVPNPVVDGPQQDANTVINPGRMEKMEIKGVVLSPKERDDVLQAGTHHTGHALYLLGHVKYMDDLGNWRRTLFCRYWNRKTGRFKQVRDGDYEYAD
jgi:hypothetical protein